MIHGKHPVLLNVTYLRADKDSNQKECFEVVYKDDYGQVRYSREPADVTFYVVKPEYRNYTYNKPEERIEHLYPVTVPYSQIRSAIAKEMGPQGENFYKEALNRKDFKALNQLYLWPYTFKADFQPEYYFMEEWYKKYPLDPGVKLSKAFMDIETDIYDYTMDMDHLDSTAYAPVNCVTIIMEELQEAYTFVLKPEKPGKIGISAEEYPGRFALYQTQLQSHEKLFNDKASFIQELHDRFDKTYGTINYHIKEFDSEIKLIKNVFEYINDRKPNVCMFWNMRFDIQYLYYRIQVLGYDPASIMCHPDFKNPRCRFILDKRNQDIQHQMDYFDCSSYTLYLCQLRTFGCIRKSQHTFKSFKLNVVADNILHDKKVEYPSETNMRLFPYRDWRLFIIYNIKDVLLQLGIERKTNDLKTFYMRAHANLTPYRKIFSETYLLRYVREQYFNQQGWVQGNNINIIDGSSSNENEFYGSSDDDDDEERTSFKGAINADPIWNDYVGADLLGSKSNNIFINAVDFDMGAFYPSCKISSNMDPITLEGKAMFDNDEFISGEFRNNSLNQKYFEKDKQNNERKVDFTGEAVQTYVAQNYLTIGYNYLSLPKTPIMIKLVEKRLKGRH